MIHQSISAFPNLVMLCCMLEMSAYLLLLQFVPCLDLSHFLEKAHNHYDKCGIGTEFHLFEEFCSCTHATMHCSHVVEDEFDKLVKANLKCTIRITLID